jgi:hypothetical protein
MHERILRRLLFAAFVGVCVCPTLLVMVWAASHRFSWRRIRLERDLTRAVAMSVAVGDVRFPRPGSMVLEGVSVSDPESGEEVARARLVEVVDTAAGRVATAFEPVVQIHVADELWRWLDQHVLRQDGLWESGVTILADQVTLETGAPPRRERAETLTGFRCLLSRTTGGPELKAAFGLAGLGQGDSVQLRVVRNRQQFPAATGVAVEAKRAVPCRLLGGKMAGTLGPRAEFQGRLWAVHTPQGWDIEIGPAQWTNVDLDRLVSDRLPRKLSGSAEMVLQQARVEQGRLVEGSGTIVAGPGYVGSSLLTAAAREMRFRQGVASAASRGATTRYHKIALSWRVDGRGPEPGFTLRGALPGGAIMTGERGDLLREPVDRTVPTAALIAALGPPTPFRVPAAPETAWLLGALPLARQASGEPQVASGKVASGE